MKTKLIIIFCCLASILFAQSPGDLPPFAEPGKCYSKCLKVSAFEEYDIEVPVYIGDPDDKTVKRKKETIILEDATSKWVKKKADRNCKSKDPEDCLVWCLVQKERVFEERVVVKDTSTTSDYVMEVFTIKELVEKGGFTEWKEVLCENKVTAYTINQINNALTARGYRLPEFRDNNVFGQETKEELKKFQRDNGLPIGNLDFETLQALGVQY